MDLFLVCGTALTDRFCITEVESLYCAVRTEYLYKNTSFVFKMLIIISVDLT